MPPRHPKGIAHESRKWGSASSSWTQWLIAAIVAAAALTGYHCLQSPLQPIVIGPIGGDDTVRYVRNVTCMTPPVFHNNNCARIVLDNLFPAADVFSLKALAEKGMSVRPAVGGPTILDLNTGYLRDTEGLINLFNDGQHSALFDQADFELYRRVIGTLKEAVESAFGLPENTIYFTAPTFITRLDGRETWNPKAIHDEYWHTHADMNNTVHYQYSGLMYLSTYGVDFTGGELSFMSSADDETVEELVHAVQGRTVTFTSGPENPHKVERVSSGQRFVLAFWFTRDKRKKFDIFLDGKAHKSFDNPSKA